MRIYNPALGKFLSVDPLTKKYPYLTPYQFASNRPIDGIDLDGLEYLDAKNPNIQEVKENTNDHTFEVKLSEKLTLHGVTKETINGTEYYNARYDLYHGEKGWSWRSKKSNSLATLHLEPSDWKYSRDEFVEYGWCKMTGTDMDEGQKKDIDAGCVGITSCVMRKNAVYYTKENGGFNKLGLAQERKKQLQLANPDSKYIIYSVRFYSADPEKFQPNAKGIINMKEWDHNLGVGINFDFGYLDEETGLWWDANNDNTKGDMEVYQKTLYKFSKRDPSFNRQIFVVAPSGL